MTCRGYVEGPPPEVAANAVICLIHQTNCLLDFQLRQLEAAFLHKGGFAERLCGVRTAEKRKESALRAIALRS